MSFLGAKFNRKKAKDEGPFVRDLEFSVGRQNVEKVLNILAQLQLPIPNPDAYMLGHAGILIFAENAGIVVRIEKSESHKKPVSDNPWLLQPLAQYKISDCVAVEVCPGCKQAFRSKDAESAYTHLKATGARFSDFQIANTGRLPFKTPQFPNGFPLVIDRPAVHRLTDDLAWVKKQIAEEMEKLGLKEDPQKTLYRDLKDKLARAWPEGEGLADVEKMNLFWQACKVAKREGRLVAGWRQGVILNPLSHISYAFFKRERAAKAAHAYKEQFKIGK